MAAIHCEKLRLQFAVLDCHQNCGAFGDLFSAEFFSPGTRTWDIVLTEPDVGVGVRPDSDNRDLSKYVWLEDHADPDGDDEDLAAEYWICVDKARIANALSDVASQRPNRRIDWEITIAMNIGDSASPCYWLGYTETFITDPPNHTLPVGVFENRRAKAIDMSRRRL